MGAPDLLQHLRSAGLTLAVDGGRLIVKPRERLTEPDRERIKAHRDELVKLLAVPTIPAAAAESEPELGRRYALTKAEADMAHADGWDDDEIARFTARVTLFMRRGLSASDADDLAERLTLRDREGDDRRLCLECSNLGERGRCLAAAMGRLPGVDRRLEPNPATLQRCEAFGLRKGLE